MKQSAISESVLHRFFTRRVQHQREYFLHPPYVIEKRLLNAVSAGKIESAVKYLQEINKLERATLAEEPLRSLKNSLICSCTLLTRAIIDGGVPPEMAFNLSDAYILEVERTDSMEKLSLLEYEMLKGFVKKLKEVNRKKHAYSHPVHLTIDYIHENILQDFSLEDMARHVYLSAAYLSHVFKKEVGTSLTDYINRERIKESIYFLMNTNSKISDIALLFHFCNQSHYTTVFKKYCGLTPTEYRDRGSK
ncbi:AraC family transcriptional regulator [Sporolactobacillus sp. THM7-4]|nr:AraC family transcriptional regulator [Sporolactobacillus sp. THM7-4]